MVAVGNKSQALLFGLSADPVHKGHTQLVAAACRYLISHQRCPSRVLVAPVGQINPVTEKTAATAEFHHRFRLCQLAFEALRLPCPVQVLDCDWQAVQAGCSHNTTWETIKTLQATRLWHEGLTVLLSADHFSVKKQQPEPAFFRWHRWQELLGKANWLIAERTGHTLVTGCREKLTAICSAHGTSINWLQWHSPAISSSQLRQWLADGPAGIRKAEPFLPESVSAYIQAKALYGAKPPA